jgi:predicted amidophosphoribosyltransferase
MPKKKKEPVVEVPETAEEEKVTCPVCGKPVGLDVTSCPYCGAEFEAEQKAPVEQAQAQQDDDMAACPVCHRMVSLSVSSCPHCGAEFEAEQEAPAQAKVAPAAPKPAVTYAEEEEEETAECPVCGKMVSLNVTSCPSCGAEFEEEEVEEIIEVEEKPAVRAASRTAPARAAPRKVTAEEEVEVEEEGPVEIEGPSSILDLRVIGISLIVLGILGSQIAFMIDWYWTWVPPIKDNLGMFIAIPAVIIVVGLLFFMLVKRAVAGGRKIPRPMPGFSLSMFLTGILVLVLVMLWSPINSALQDSNVGVGAAFVIVIVVGALAMIMGMRASSRASA